MEWGCGEEVTEEDISEEGSSAKGEKNQRVGNEFPGRGGDSLVCWRTGENLMWLQPSRKGQWQEMASERSVAASTGRPRGRRLDFILSVMEGHWEL